MKGKPPGLKTTQRVSFVTSFPLFQLKISTNEVVDDDVICIEGVALTSDESDKVVGSVYDNLTEDIIGELDNVLAINRPNLFVTSFDAKVRFEWLLSDDCFNGFCSMHRSSYGKKKKQ